VDDIRERLARLGVTRGMPPPKPQAPPASPRPGIEALIDGEVVETPLGACFVAEERRPVKEAHGRVPLAAFHTHANGALAALARDAALQDVDPTAVAFIDAETSGLAGGTGTYTFLVGVGFFDGATFCVRQFFMRGPHEEPALIHLLDEFLARFRAVVTFNGRSFDLPLLQTRFTLHRRRFPLEGVPHLDLLPPARRLWKRRLPSCALSSLEEHLLGLVRDGDVPGWLIPSLYFDYLRTGNAAPLRPVFTHNAQDVLSLVGLAAHMATTLVDPEAVGVVHGADWYSLGRCYEELGWVERAAAAYERALHAPCAPDVRHAALHALSFLHKRQGRWEQAVAIWQELVASGVSDRLYPYEELAKYYEHRQRDPATALRLVREAIRGIEAGELRPRRPRQRALAELRHRQARLERKVERMGGERIAVGVAD